MCEISKFHEPQPTKNETTLCEREKPYRFDYAIEGK